jgi:hypothetical protein
MEPASEATSWDVQGLLKLGPPRTFLSRQIPVRRGNINSPAESQF